MKRSYYSEDFKKFSETDSDQILGILTNLLWIWYSIEIKSLPLLISSILSLLILIAILIFKIIHEK